MLSPANMRAAIIALMYLILVIAACNRGTKRSAGIYRGTDRTATASLCGTIAIPRYSYLDTRRAHPCCMRETRMKTGPQMHCKCISINIYGPKQYGRQRLTRCHIEYIYQIVRLNNAARFRIYSRYKSACNIDVRQNSVK